MHPGKRDAEVIDLIEYFDILQIRKVIDADNHAAIQLVFDAYLSEKDYQPEGGVVSEVAEPENGEEEAPSEEGNDEAGETETKPEGEESEATE
jgi:hypothetical protein